MRSGAAYRLHRFRTGDWSATCVPERRGKSSTRGEAVASVWAIGVDHVGRLTRRVADVQDEQRLNPSLTTSSAYPHRSCDEGRCDRGRSWRWCCSRRSPPRPGAGTNQIARRTVAANVITRRAPRSPTPVADRDGGAVDDGRWAGPAGGCSRWATSRSIPTISPVTRSVRCAPSLRDADLSIVNVEMAIGDPDHRGHAGYEVVHLPRLADGGVAPRQGRRRCGQPGQQPQPRLRPGHAAHTIGRLRGAGVEPVGAGADDGAAYTAVIQHRRRRYGARARSSRPAACIPNQAGRRPVVQPGVASAYNAPVSLRPRCVRPASRPTSSSCSFTGARSVSLSERRPAQAGRLPSARQVPLPCWARIPHVLQPIVRDGDGVVAYSLGNFVFDRRTGPAGESLVLEIGFRRHAARQTSRPTRTCSTVAARSR